ncbi:uncharacterized protein [Miscanthus floridulus]|uniref:uncharacterized protein n=1 Tax=Miscanthus floridulus TaxID=154761 RepID=UPI003457FEFC
MPTVDENPLFDADQSTSDSSEASFTSSVDIDVSATNTPPTSVLQTVNIKSHVPVLLKLAEPNYDEWRCFFDTFLSKFGLTSHVSPLPTSIQRCDLECRIIDQCVQSWLYNSISKDVCTIVCSPHAIAYHVWDDIHTQFRYNELHRTVYLESKFRSLV